MVSIVHGFASGIADDPGAAAAGKVLPSYWNDDHDIDFAATKRVLGRNTAGAGAGEEVTATQLLDWLGTAAEGDIIRRGAASWELLNIGASGTVFTSNGTTGTWSAAATIPFADSSAIIKGSADATKLARFEIDGFTTGTTRVFTLQNRDGTLADDTDLALKANLASPNFSGTPTIAGAAIATQAYVAASSGYAKAWGYATIQTSGSITLTLNKGFNIASITRSGTIPIITFSTPMADANYSIVIWDEAGIDHSISGKNTADFRLTGADFSVSRNINFIIFD